MRHRTKAFLLSVLAAGGPLLIALGCSGDETTGPNDQTGAVQVSAATSGADFDADGYNVSVDGGAARNIASDGTTTFSGVSAGQHQVALSGLADNCAVTGDNPVAASVSGGATASVSFQVSCDPLAGFIQVSTSTSGSDLDSDGYTATLDGGSGRSIGLNGVTTFSGVAVGQRQVELTGIASNCSVDGSNPAAALVTAGETAQVSFDATCEAIPVGSLEVTTTVTNNFDPDGYQVFVAGVERGQVEVAGTGTFEDLPAGAQEVELRGIAPNCAVDGDNPATVAIPAGGTASAAVSVTCTSPPDGRILFMSWPPLWFSVMNADGSGQFRLMEPLGSSWEWGTWSPDGSRIAFSSNANAVVCCGHDIYVMNKDASGLVQFTTDPAMDIHPAWSPDGSQIAFVSDRTGSEEIFVMSAEGSGITQITDDPGTRASHPDWSPDGLKIVFDRMGTGPGITDHDIFVMNADGTESTRLSGPSPTCNIDSPLMWSDIAPQWSPDGSKIAFQRLQRCTSDPNTDVADILVMNPDGTDIVNSTPGPEDVSLPRWSPDGTRIVYWATAWGDNGGVQLGIWVMNADGTQPTQISPNGYYPDWGP